MFTVKMSHQMKHQTYVHGVYHNDNFTQIDLYVHVHLYVVKS